MKALIQSALSAFGYRITRNPKSFGIIDLDVPPREDFVTWLRFAVAGMTAGGNEQAFEYVASTINGDEPVVEVGSFCGLSTILIDHYLKKYGKTNRLFTCDRWVFEGQELGESLGGSSLMTHDRYKEFVKETYMRNIHAFLQDNKPYTIETFSDEFFDEWTTSSTVNDVFGRTVTLGGPISFYFIDGNHLYGYAKRDFLNADKHLIKGGFLLFDDSGDGSGWEVNRLAREVESEGKYSLVARNPNYLFQKR